MSTGGFQTISISTPTTPATPSNCLENSSSDPDILASQEIPPSQLESSMLLKRENSPETAVGSPGFIVDPPHSQSQATALSHAIDADYNSNSFNFSYGKCLLLVVYINIKNILIFKFIFNCGFQF